MAFFLSFSLGSFQMESGTTFFSLGIDVGLESANVGVCKCRRLCEKYQKAETNLIVGKGLDELFRDLHF